MSDGSTYQPPRKGPRTTPYVGTSVEELQCPLLYHWLTPFVIDLCLAEIVDYLRGMLDKVLSSSILCYTSGIGNGCQGEGRPEVRRTEHV